MHTFHSHSVSVFDVPLRVLSNALVLAPITLRNISEAQAAVEHFFSDPGLRHFTVLPQPCHRGSWTEEGRENIAETGGTLIERDKRGRGQGEQKQDVV